MITKIELHEDGESCDVHTEDGFVVSMRVAAARAKTRFERAYTQQTNRVWTYRGDHKALVEPLLRNAETRCPVTGQWRATRNWALDYCHQNHLDRGLDDAKFFSGAALFEHGRYIVQRKSLLSNAREHGFCGHDQRFSKDLKAAGLRLGKPTTIANTSVRPWVLDLSEEELA
ncbi:hypothetical protein [Ruegeria sp.]|uniref:hypothetical protein n=1 Tax=Ruegeria sp. TaxID=1879320 RepID=UPI003B59D59B